MAKTNDKKEEPKSSPAASKGTRSAGSRKTAKKNQELRRCRQALLHHQKRGWMTDALEQHMRTLGGHQERCAGREARRTQSMPVQKEREEAKAAKRKQKWAQQDPQLAADIAAVQSAAGGA